MKIVLNQQEADNLFEFLADDNTAGRIYLEYKVHNSGTGLYAWVEGDDDTPTWIAGPDCQV